MNPSPVCLNSKATNQVTSDNETLVPVGVSHQDEVCYESMAWLRDLKSLRPS